MPTEPTPKQLRFIDEYLIDLNATQAAIRSGYSPRTAQEQGSRLLSKAIVQSALAVRRAKLAATTEVTPERVINELAKLAFSDMRDFAEWGPAGVSLKASDGLSRDAARCVGEVSESRSKDGGSIRFKLHDKVTALTQLGRHFGLFTDKIEDVSKLPREERRERLLKLLA